MVFEKIRRAHIEARRLYNPGVFPMLALFVGLAVASLFLREWAAAATCLVFAAVTGRLLYKADHRWRATDESE